MAGRIFHLGLLGLVLAAGAGGYTLRRNLGTPGPQTSDCARHWLSLSGSQCEGIGRDDPGFHAESQALAQSLRDRQEGFIRQVSDPNTPADRIRGQAEVVLEAHHALARRIVQHLLALRRHVDIRQCTLLNQLCTEVMRPEDLPNPERAQDQDPPGRYGRQRGRGGPWWRDPNQTWGRHGYRYGQLAPALGLTEAQADPNYESDAARLTQQVRETHALLARAIQDPNAPDWQVQQTLEDFLAAHRELELRTVDYVLRIRPTLGIEQQERLIGLSRRGRRWHGGRP